MAQSLGLFKMMRPLVVVGPPSSGKSELAQWVANRTRRPLELADGQRLEALLSEHSPAPPVIDLSSVAWLERPTRILTLDRSVVVSVGDFDGCDGTHTSSDGGSDNPLWKHLATPFLEAHCVVQFNRQKLGSIAEDVTAVWQRDPVAVAAGERSYVVDIGRGILEHRVQALLKGNSTLLLVTDSNVQRLHGARANDALAATGSRVVSAVFEAGEAQKHLGTLRDIFEAAQRGGIDRGSPVVAFGGGVVTDIGGLTAATWLRGLRWFAVPTTLLGMVDASVGGKTAVNFGEAKNAMGAFWQPVSVICDVDWLQTESDRNYASALAEVVKTAIIGDPELFELLESHRDPIVARDPELLVDVVRRCIRVKARIVGTDERESGPRAVLNLGHTIGHAIEAVGGFGRRTHGEAVALGLVAALRLGQRVGLTAPELAPRVGELLKSFGLEVDLAAADLKAATDNISYDKKRRGSLIRFVFVRAIGAVEIQPVVVEDLRDLLATLCA